MPDVFTTAVLARVVAALENTPISFALTGMRDPNAPGAGPAFGGFFPGVQTATTEEIHFDVETESRRLTPFVSPIVAGRVVKSKGFTTKSFKPAYAKDKRVFNPDAPLKRIMGEGLMGTLTPQQRRDAKLAEEIRDQLAMLTRREEAMAWEALRTGNVTVSGDGFATVQVNFGRAAALDVTLAGADLWSDAASTPVTDLEDWAGLVQDNNGGVPTEVVMAPNVWNAFRVHAKVKDLLDVRRGGGSMAELGPLAGKVRQPGSVGDFRIWVYNESYVDDAGATKRFLPVNELVLVSGELEGTRAYGVIQDEAAQYLADRFFVKSWLENDPAVRFLLLQSAPLVIPYRPNASLRADVL